jgi:hypothetical protein
MRQSFWGSWIFWYGWEKGVTERTWLYNDTILPKVMITKSIIIVYIVLLFHNFFCFSLVLSWFFCDCWNMNRYSSMCRMVQKLVSTVKQMDPKDPFRVDMTDKLLEKLWVHTSYDWYIIFIHVFYFSLWQNFIIYCCSKTNIAANYV